MDAKTVKMRMKDIRNDTDGPIVVIYCDPCGKFVVYNTEDGTAGECMKCLKGFCLRFHSDMFKDCDDCCEIVCNVCNDNMDVENEVYTCPDCKSEDDEPNDKLDVINPDDIGTCKKCNRPNVELCSGLCEPCDDAIW